MIKKHESTGVGQQIRANKESVVLLSIDSKCTSAKSV